MTKRVERPLDIKNGRVDMTHGSGGRAMAQLIEQMFAAAFANPALAEGNDQARLSLPMDADGQPPRLAFSTDSYVISPLFFPGGNIGSLAVHGTVNDVAMAGARPLWLSAGFILEEGFPLADLEKIVTAMAEAARESGVDIVTGDTKVVEKGKADGVFINTSGVGVIEGSHDLSVRNIRAGDAVLVSGTIGDHGIAILAAREKMEFDEPLLSDSASLSGLIAAMLASGAEIRALRDPTRGGLAATLNEMATAAGLGIRIDEAALPIRASVRGACEILGLDPLTIANEGKLLAFCAPADAEKLLAAMRAHPAGKDAAIIGTARQDAHCFVEMKTSFGGHRMVDWLVGEQLPRIC